MLNDSKRSRSSVYYANMLQSLKVDDFLPACFFQSYFYLKLKSVDYRNGNGFSDENLYCCRNKLCFVKYWHTRISCLINKHEIMLTWKCQQNYPFIQEGLALSQSLYIYLLSVFLFYLKWGNIVLEHSIGNRLSRKTSPCTLRKQIVKWIHIITIKQVLLGNEGWMNIFISISRWEINT